VAGHPVATRISAGCVPFPTTVRPLIRRRQALALRSAVSEALRTILRTAMQQPAIAAARQPEVEQARLYLTGNQSQEDDGWMGERSGEWLRSARSTTDTRTRTDLLAATWR